MNFQSQPSLFYLPLAQPPWTKLGKKLESMCRKAIFEFQLLNGCSRLAIALSGGKDSLTLLYLLHAMQGRGIPPLELYAIHVRGEFSCGPNISFSFIQKICDHLKIPLIIKESKKVKKKLECYSCSRERRRLLFTTAKSLNITTIAFGHHRDDSIQTLLLNLLHKGEFAANLAKIPMHKYGITIIRPLLFIPEDSIREFAALYGFAKITCQCPVGQKSKRNQVKQILEIMNSEFPNAKKNLMQAALQYGSQKALLP